MFSSPDRSCEERGNLANKDNERDDYDDNDKDHLENTPKKGAQKNKTKQNDRGINNDNDKAYDHYNCNDNETIRQDMP